MTVSILNIITAIIIGGTIIYFIVLLIIAQIKYSSFLDYAKKFKPDYKEDLGGLWVTEKGGGWVVNEYWFRSPLPIAIKTKNKELKKLADIHDKTIRLFWISAVTILPIEIIVLNFIN